MCSLLLKHSSRDDIPMLGGSPIKWITRPDMTIAFDWDVKQHINQTVSLVYVYFTEVSNDIHVPSWHSTCTDH